MPRAFFFMCEWTEPLKEPGFQGELPVSSTTALVIAGVNYGRNA